MAEWHLTDGREPADGPEEFPSVVIESENQLRDELHRLQKLEPGIVALNGPAEKAIQIGIGGPVAGIRYYEAPKKSPRFRVVLADRPCCEKQVDFLAEGDTVAFFPESLFAVEEAIEIVVHFFKHQELPDSVSWKEWNPVTKQWRMHRRVPVPS